MSRIAMLVALATLAFILDQGTKWLIVEWVMQPPRVIEVTDFFNLVLGHNTGVSFGMFGSALAERQDALIGLKLAIVAALSLLALRGESALERAGFAVVAGGALGNILDRLRLSGVTDFLDFHWNGWHWPAFNLADVAITAGVGLVLLSSFRRPPDAPRADGLA